MFGSLRLLLAIMVVVSHVGGNIGGVWIGVVAVVVFYMISGYAMTALIETRFPDTKSAPSFYMERVTRLAPQYYFWITLSLLAVFGLGWTQLNAKNFVPYEVTAYLTIIPLGLQRYLGSVDTLLMPQATTLGIEMTFYLVAPWVVRSRWLCWAAGLLGLGIFVATAMSALPENIYTYFTSPGPIIFFVIGSFLYRRWWTSLGVFSAMLGLVLLYGLPQRFNNEFLIGVFGGLPVLIALSRLKANPIDSTLGDASYGCFLCHCIAIWGVQYFLGVTAFTPATGALVVVLAVAGGFVGYWLVEKPTVPLRRRIKGAVAVSAYLPRSDQSASQHNRPNAI